MSSKINLSDELAILMEGHLSGKIAQAQSKNFEKTALLNEIEESIELLENNSFASKILTQIKTNILKEK
jgi:hypothetical protein